MAGADVVMHNAGVYELGANAAMRERMQQVNVQGEDYLFCGEPVSGRGLFEQWERFPGGMKWRVWLPRWLMRLQMALLEPLLRAAGLPAFLSRDAVDVTKAHLNYSSAQASRDLGWSHPGGDEMWERIVRREREWMGQRKGFRERLKHEAVCLVSGDVTPSR